MSENNSDFGAFLAGFVHQFLKSESTNKCLELASAMGAYVAKKSGATPTLDIKELVEIQYGQSAQQVA